MNHKEILEKLEKIREDLGNMVIDYLCEAADEPWFKHLKGVAGRLDACILCFKQDYAKQLKGGGKEDGVS